MEEVKVKTAVNAFVASVATILCSLAILFTFASGVFSYPPAVGLSGNSQNCLSCHADNGPWKDDDNIIVDIVDKVSGKSLGQPDGTFLIRARKGETVTVITVLGRKAGDTAEPPQRNAWIFIDRSSQELSRLPKGWDVNVQYSCRVIGDKQVGFEGANITSAPMIVKAGSDAIDGILTLQAMITKGMSAKNKPDEGLVGNYVERQINLKVID